MLKNEIQLYIRKVRTFSFAEMLCIDFIQFLVYVPILYCINCLFTERPEVAEEPTDRIRPSQHNLRGHLVNEGNFVPVLRLLQ